MTGLPAVVRLDGGDTSLILRATGCGPVELAYLGARLPTGDRLEGAAVLAAPIRRESAPDSHAGLSLLPVNGFGFLGEPALAAHRGGDGAIGFDRCQLIPLGENGALVEHEDTRLGMRVRSELRMDGDTGVIEAHSVLTNLGAGPLAVDWLAAIALPAPDWARRLLVFDGRWAKEHNPHHIALDTGVWSRTNRGGRTGFAGSTLILCGPATTDLAGPALAIHLGWSGSHRVLAETRPEGDRQVQVGAYLAPGEIELAPGQSFASPQAYLALSQRGFAGLSERFHPFVKNRIIAPLGPRKVHFNTWEAVYFDFDEARLMALATQAAALGVERFVIDDGWFTGRRNDQAGLGDWRIDVDRFPGGLAPVCEHVRSLGMDVGLWVEPEMASPQSDLARDHPDWILASPGAPAPTMRRQWVLDLANPAVGDYLFGAIDAVLRAAPIAYLKWDFNRDLFPAPRQHARTRAFYDLLARIRARHPTVEIESCASGGARADLGVLRHATRIWPSDQTDALERVRIQRWAGLVFPLAVLGAHVGPSPNPITGRSLAMDFRAKLAMFGHFGVEADPGRLDAHERESLSQHIALYKEHRAFLHDGQFSAWTTPDGVTCLCVTGWDQARMLALLIQTDMAPGAEPQPVTLPTLSRQRMYRVRALDPLPHAARRLADPQAWREGAEMSGTALAQTGLRLPLIDPCVAWLVEAHALD